ncbi:MAG: TetR/AcrR family transcriptional regulator [Firmicutes bacterium]|jgi:AcrR family transcriptional regulator|nr:TetR/AcrR family transcriptional regulator [Bacillota bacterium]
MKKELTPRKRQAIEMRAKIQSAALTLFNREGFENVSVEEIAQTVGCSVGNIYHYFKSKDELAIQVTQMVDEAYTALEEEYLADRETSGREKLLDFVGRSLEISASDEMLYKAFIHGLRYPEQAVLQKNDKRVYYRLLRELVDLCQEEGSIHPSYDPDCLVEDLVVLHRGTLFEWRIYQEGFDIAKQGRRMADALLRGWQTEPTES